jgi:hypothetical protein
MSSTTQFINNRSVLFTNLEAQKSKVNTLADSVSGEGLVSVLQMEPSYCVPCVGGVSKFLQSSLIIALIPVMRVKPS